MLIGSLIRLYSNHFKRTFHRPDLNRFSDTFIYQTLGPRTNAFEPVDSEDKSLYDEVTIDSIWWHKVINYMLWQIMDMCGIGFRQVM
jgi:hypothetical protein